MKIYTWQDEHKCYFFSVKCETEGNLRPIISLQDIYNYAVLLKVC